VEKVQSKTALKVRDVVKASEGYVDLEPLAGMNGAGRHVREITVNRPGLALAGHFPYFPNKRVQVIGNAESTYLKSLSHSERIERMRALFKRHIPCLIYSRNLRPDMEILKLADQARTPVLRSSMITKQLINRLTLSLDRQVAPRALVQAGMVDIQGCGVMIRGRSGIGKSECMLALIKRGHSLVSDDVTHVTLLQNGGHPELLCTSVELTRFHMEVRGLGIINIPAVFGISSIRVEKRVDLVVHLKDWAASGEIDRVGLVSERYNILGVEVPEVSVPVAPGREVSQLVELAALNQKLRSMGFHAALEFDKRVKEVLKKGSRRVRTFR
jgi:HPr kinase/phosphorylase